MAGEFTTDMGVLAGITGLNNRFEWYYGDTEPINPRPFLNWAHLSEDLWKQRNLENTAWVVRGKLSEAYFGLAQKIDVKPHGSALFTNNSVFTVPENVDVVWVTLAGGGGGGIPEAYGGGGGDAKIKQRVEVTPGEVIIVTVGAGGGPGASGGASSFGSYVSCSGGASGATGVAGGPGGSAAGGVAGGGSIFGLGSQGQSVYSNFNGSGFGGGGARGTTVGGKGAPGFVLVEW